VTFDVNTAADTTDANTADNHCDVDTGAGGDQCTLRAAIEQANATSGADTITVNASVKLSTLQPATGYPTITEQVSIDGCSSDPNHAGPCLGIASMAQSFDGLHISGDDVTVRGLAITGMSNGIEADDGADRLTVKNCWLGTKLDLNKFANFSTGIVARGDGAQIGGTAGASGSAPADRNVISSTNFTALSLVGADDATVQGNYIGTDVAGTDTGFMRQGVDVESTPTDTATGTLIGGTVAAPAATSTACDGACNVISGTSFNASPGNGNGINLGIVSGNNPALTTIRGNFIGLDVTGTSDLGSGQFGINVGDAPVEIGGPASGDRNYIGGNGSSGINQSGDGGGPYTIQNNFIGLSSSGTAAVPDGIAGVSLADTSPISVTIARNRFGGDGTNPSQSLWLRGTGGTVVGNVLGVGVGDARLPAHDAQLLIEGGSGYTIGGPLDTERNFIGGGPLAPDAPGILVLGGSSNTIVRNAIGVLATPDIGNGGPGIRIAMNSDDNVIDENTLSHNGGDGLEIVGDGNDGNLLRNNYGADNDGIFIDLNPFDGPGNDPSSGPNDGIQTPVITNARPAFIRGTAPAGSTVDVYQSDGAGGVPGPGSIQTTADGTGHWQIVNSPGPFNNGARFAATATNGTNTSELSAARTVDGAAPETTITAGPRNITTLDRTPTFRFRSSEAGSTFQCSVDGAAFESCASPFTTATLKNGQHLFRVRATDAEANTDQSSAGRVFRVGPLGTNGRDTIVGTPASEKACGRGGADTIDLRGGNDVLYGGSCGPRNPLAARIGAVELSAAAADGGDILKGGRGNDFLSGGRGKDVYRAGPGNDTVRAADGVKETVDCGKGKNDRATVDKADDVSGCEHVTRK
jgi:hypothetical protein